MQRTDTDEPFVRALLRDQHPDLADLPIRPVAGGWGNQLWRVSGELAVRLPMTQDAPELLANEFRWLPQLAGRLPLPVPTPLRFSEPSERFPRPWTVVKWVPGEPADGAEITEVARSADVLAGFLRALHRPAPDDAPVNPRRCGDLAPLTESFEGGLKSLVDDADAPRLRDVWKRAVAAPRWGGPPVWVHVDLHPANALVTDGVLSGVIDFGDMGAGDPAADVAAAWKLLPEGGADGFLRAYGDADEAMVHRAQGWAVLSAFGLLSVGRAWEQGLPGGQPTWGRAGRRTLERVLAHG
ncbi:aminoglycoside phosphotransferase family protein [Streptomyces roseirectus]|uniref:Aminoglycoside phosphotransferase family protein n=1 Tax=Streptomyces roseirectus TaxID=2768066 RepID=A0A7H0IHA1_9ACTN|nr:aminoglycoside phosphotransferase family protein [Streptomyces roseirectus]QNP72167.1 aminoglycoside phosphotransferase family protein [Streptomyces roseirectus]